MLLQVLLESSFCLAEFSHLIYFQCEGTVSFDVGSSDLYDFPQKSHTVCFLQGFAFNVAKKLFVRWRMASLTCCAACGEPACNPLAWVEGSAYGWAGVGYLGPPPPKAGTGCRGCQIDN